MAIFKCKICGGNLEIQEGMTVCECEYCGTEQTLPKVNEEKFQNLFNRANLLRMKAEFDKAAEIYEKIIQNNEEEAEAYWGLILCKYGVEYVEDPATYERIPTCHRASFEAITSDEDYKAALKYSDSLQRSIYEKQAKQIEQIQKEIIEIAQNEKPYDVFICYKETDENGKRTQDSVIANDIYYQLTQEGYKVFYAAITLEDKLGQEYEPYIFSALNSSKVLLAIGTKPEHFNAVWVKNEWSRFLKIMKKDRSKLLIPCYRDMDAYELPEEFAHLQAQDMSKIGFINDIVRGIKKLISKEDEKAKATETVVVQQNVGGTTVEAQIKRGNMALEDHDWEKANSFFEEALNLNPECAEAYLGKLLARDRKTGLVSWVVLQKEKYQSVAKRQEKACPINNVHIEKTIQEYAVKGYLSGEEIKKLYSFDLSFSTAYDDRKNQKKDQLQELTSDRLLSRAKQYASGATKKELEEALAEITAVLDQRIIEAEKEHKEDKESVKAAYEKHLADMDQQAKEMNVQAQKCQEEDYQKAVSLMNAANDILSYEKALAALVNMDGYKDSKAHVQTCEEEIKRLQEEKRLEEERLEEERRKEEESKEQIRKENAERMAKKIKKIAVAVAGAAVACVVAFFVVTKVIVPNNSYKNAVALMEEGNVTEALEIFEQLGDYKDSPELIKEIQTVIIPNNKYEEAVAQMETGDVNKALEIFEQLGDYKDSSELAKEIRTVIIPNNKYEEAVAQMETGDVNKALEIFEQLGDYKDSSELAKKIRTVIIPNNKYKEAVAQMKAGNNRKALGLFDQIGNYKDSREFAKKIRKDYWKTNSIIAVGDNYAVGLKTDGSVVATGDNTKGQCDVASWKNIVAVATGDNHTVGLKADGSVAATGEKGYYKCDVSNWKNIVAVAAGIDYTAGLKADGSVITTYEKFSKGLENKYDVSNWKNIKTIASGSFHIVGLKSDGTVVATGDNKYGQCNVSSWTDIVAVTAGSFHTVGLRSDGTVVATGKTDGGECDVSEWKNIAAVAAGFYTVGLRSDGTVVAAGMKDNSGVNVSEWKDIVAISEDNGCIVGVKSDGSVISSSDRIDVDSWTDINVSTK